MALWCKSWSTCSILNGGPLRKGSLVFPVTGTLGAILTVCAWANQADAAVRNAAVHKAEMAGFSAKGAAAPSQGLETLPR
jgi:hypothetical protein